MFNQAKFSGLMERRHVFWILLGACSAAAFWLRVVNLAEYGLQFDEVASLVASDFGTLFSVSARMPTFKPFFLYNQFLSLWYRMVGNTEFILRITSVLFGTGAVFGIAFLGKELFDRRTGLLAAFVLCISPLHIHYSQELTIYAATVFFTVFSTYFLLKLLQRGSALSAAGMLMANTVNVYINHTAFLVVVIQIVYLLARKKHSGGAIKTAWITTALQGIFLLPWFFIMIRQFMFMLDYTSNDRQVVPFLTFISPARLFYTLNNFSAGYYAPAFVRTAAAAFMGGLCVFSFCRMWSEDKIKYRMLLLFFCFPPLVLFFFSKFIIMFSDRYIISSAVFFYIAVAFALGRLRPVSRVIAGMFLIGVSALSLTYYYANRMESVDYERPGVTVRKEFKRSVCYLKRYYEDGDIVLHLCENSTWPIGYYMLRERLCEEAAAVLSPNMADFMVNYYFKKRGEPKIILQDLKNNTFFVHTNDFIETSGAPGTYIDGKRIWVVYSTWEWRCWESVPFSREITEWLLRRYRLAEYRDYFGVRIGLFEKIEKEA